MKTSKFLLAVAILSLAGTAVAYFFLPETIPMHWNFEGEVDSWGPRWSILALGCLPLGVAMHVGIAARLLGAQP